MSNATAKDREIKVRMPEWIWHELPHEKIEPAPCQCCGVHSQVYFHVDDIVWLVVTQEFSEAAGRDDSFLCLDCFDRMAAEKNITYTITTMIFSGRQCANTLKFSDGWRLDGTIW